MYAYTYMPVSPGTDLGQAVLPRGKRYPPLVARLRRGRPRVFGVAERVLLGRLLGLDVERLID